MPSESQIPIASQATSRRFATRLALFYGTLFGLVGTHLPFFPVWLKAVGIDASWIGIITAVPAVTRFTALPFVTGLAERRQALRGALIVAAFATALGLALVGTQHQPLAIFLIYVVTSCLWTLDDAADRRLCAARRGALRAELRAAAAVGLGGLRGRRAGLRAAGRSHRRRTADLGDRVGGGARRARQPRAAAAGQSENQRRPRRTAPRALLRDPGFLAIIAASALIQGSHAAYYVFASIAWQQSGLGGLTIAGLWSLGVLAEIVVFALSPRFTLQPSLLVVIAALCAVARWSITAQDPPIAVLAVVQLAHGLTFGLTMVGTMGLMVRHVPIHVMARGQGYLAACTGIVTSTASISSGMIFARYGQGVYYLMAAMALSGGVIMWLARRRLIAFSSKRMPVRVEDASVNSDHPHSAASGG